MVLGVSPTSVWRHPFPGPGLAIRVLGALDRERLHMARLADAILIQELRAAGEYDKIGQAFVVLLNCKVGSQGFSGRERSRARSPILR